MLTERCWACNCPRRLTTHHVIPLELGGKDVLANMMRLCHPCHKIVHWRGGPLDAIVTHYGVLQSKQHIKTERSSFQRLLLFARMAKRVQNPAARPQLELLIEIITRLERLQSSPRTVLQDVFGGPRIPSAPFDNSLQKTTTP